MFKFLKDKLKNAISKFSKKVEEKSEPDQEPVEEPVEEAVEDDIEEPVQDKPKVPVEEEPADEPVIEPEQPVEDEKVEKEPSEEPEEQVEDEPETVDEVVEETIEEEPVEEKPVVSKEPEAEPVEIVEDETEPEQEEPEKEPEPVEEPIEKEPEEPVEEKPEEEIVEEPKEEVPDEETIEDEPEETAEPEKEEPEEVKPVEEKQPVPAPEEVLETTKKPVHAEAKKPKPAKGLFSRIKDKITETVTTRSLSEAKFDELFWELEMALLENNVALEVIDKIKKDLKVELVQSKIRIGKTQEVILSSLASSIDSLFDVQSRDIVKEAGSKKPYVILFVGVNGVGKTTTIAKMARLLEKNKLKSVMAAGDTFRAAAIQQLEEHATKLGVKLIKHDYGSDSAAIAFDAIKYAKSKNIDVVLVDTAGRQHSNANLMEEMKKISRVANPDLKIFVGESITGNDCIEQAKKFNDVIGIDGIILTKADVDEKGGAAMSISYVTGKPIIYIGTGQGYNALEKFNKSMITDNLGL